VNATDSLHTGRDKLGHSGNAKLGHSGNAKLGHSVNAKLGHSVKAKLGHSVKVKLGHSVNAKLGHSVNAKLGHSGNAKLTPDQRYTAKSTAQVKGRALRGGYITIPHRCCGELGGRRGTWIIHIIIRCIYHSYHH
jgi:hypothetical protein